MGNPPIALKGGPPRGALLDPTDGLEFSACLQCALLAANSITGHYPALMSAPALEGVRGTPTGQVVLAHLTGVAYSYWEAAPAGPGVCTLAARHLVPPMDAICRNEAAVWGTTRLNCDVEERLTIVTETDAGSVVADAAGKTFYLVCGLKSSPAEAVTRAGIALPATVRLTALPFRGVLVYDGLIGGGQPVPVTGAAKAKLLAAYEAAVAAGAVVTGLQPPAGATSRSPPPPPPVDTSDLRTMSVSALKALLVAGGSSAQGCVEKKDLIARAAALRAADAAAAADDGGGWTNPDGTFKQLVPEAGLSRAEAKVLATLRKATKGDGGLVFRRVDPDDIPAGAGAGANLVTIMTTGGTCAGMFSTASEVPTAAELLEQLGKAVARSGTLPAMLSADDAAAARGMDRVTRHVNVHTGFYPRASVEERALLTTIPPPVLASVGARYQR